MKHDLNWIALGLERVAQKSHIIGIFFDHNIVCENISCDKGLRFF